MGLRRRSFLAELQTRGVSPLPVAVFRISFCAIVIAEIAQLFSFRHLLFDVVPFRVEGPAVLTALLGLWMAAVALVAVGWKTRWAALVSYALAVAFLGFVAMKGGFDYHHDVMIIPALGIFALLPVGRSLSIDSLVDRARSAHRDGRYQEPARSITAWAIVLPMLVLGSVYIDSLVGKFASSLWTNGLGVWAPATFPFATWWDVTPLLEHRLLMLVSGFVAFAYEATFAIGVLFRQLRPVYGLVGLALHFGIALIYPIPLFGLGAAAFVLLLFPVGWYARAGRALAVAVRRLGVTEVRYNRGCDDCRRWSAVISSVDFFGTVHVEAHSDGECDHALVLRRPRREVVVARGDAALRAVLAALRWPLPALVLWALPGGLRRWLLAHARTSLTRKRPVPDRLTSLMHRTAPNAKLRDRSIALALSVWVAAVAVVAMRDSAVGDGATYGSLRRPLRWLYAFTGIRDHSVFVDNHFRGYDRVYSLWERRNGTLQVIPLITEAGEAGPLLRGRVWVLWGWRVAAPRVEPEQRIAGIRRFVRFWRGSAGRDGGDGEVLVRERALEVSLDRWQPGLPRRNREAPWRDVARLTIGP